MLMKKPHKYNLRLIFAKKDDFEICKISDMFFTEYTRTLIRNIYNARFSVEPLTGES